MSLSHLLTTDAARSSIAIFLFAILGLGAPNAGAQDPTKPRWQRSFDDVEIKTIRPDDLPKAEESVLPAALAKKSALPRPTSLSTLRETSARLGPLVLEVIVLPRSNSPIRQTPIVVRGEAFWVSAKDGATEPVLITNAHFVGDVDAIFVKRIAVSAKEGALPTAQRTSVTKLSLGADVRAALNDPDLIPVKAVALDKHRNLAVLQSDDERFVAPTQGLSLFPIEDEATSSAYGFSHKMGSTLVVMQFLAPKKKKEELTFYLHSTFPVILGAPIVDAKGRVIALTAMRHPADPERTLVIPPRALQRYIKKVQGLDVEDAKP